MAMKTTKICAGCYDRTDGRNVVTVVFHEHMKGWIAAAAWDRHRYTDPIQTKREAILNADHMLESAEAF